MMKSVIPLNKLHRICKEEFNIIGPELVLPYSVSSEIVAKYGLAHGYKPNLKDVDFKRTLSETGEARKQLPTRPAVITVMGHVDHGKTSLLDALRGTNTAAHEAGGITQSVSAFKVPFDKQTLTFLDTPGHGAFHIMRETGSGVADIVLLVVAIDEGVKPQTKESVGMAVRAKTPILAAINKIDLGGDPAKLRIRIKRLVPAPLLLGTVEVSAKRRQNLDALRDAILRASTEVDPRAPTAVPVEGSVIEAVVDRSKGHIIRGVVHRGTLSAGQHLVAGLESGRVRALFSDTGAPIKEARAGEPVQIAGLGGTPLPGEAFFVNTKERIEEVVEYRKLQLRYQEQQEWAESQPQIAAPVSAVGAQYSVGRRREERKVAMKKRRQAGLGARPAAKPKTQASEEEEAEEEEGDDDEGLGVRVPLVVKAGNVGSLVMLLNSLHELSDPDVNVAVVHASVGEVKPRDIMHAEAEEDCPIMCFDAAVSKQLLKDARAKGVQVKLYSVVFDLLDDVKGRIMRLVKEREAELEEEEED